MRGYADIPAEAQALIGRTGEFSTDIKEGPILAQSWWVLDRIRQTVEAAGVDVGCLQAGAVLPQSGPVSAVQPCTQAVFPGESPASTVVEVTGMLPTPDILIEVEATAYLPLR